MSARFATLTMLALLLCGFAHASETLATSPATDVSAKPAPATAPAPQEKVAANEKAPAPSANPDDLQIDLTASGQKRIDETDTRKALELLRKDLDGDKPAHEAWAALDERLRMRALAQAAEGGQEKLRRRAAEELKAAEMTGLEGTDRAAVRKALARVTVAENDDAIRADALAAWQKLVPADEPAAVREMAEGLERPNAIEQRRAFGALRAVGGPGVVQVLIRKITKRWGRIGRAHILIAEQRSYIADYDVSGATFDPVIRSFLTGVVLDSEILAVEMSHYVVEQLRAMGARDAQLADPAAWQRFLAAR